MELKPQEIPVEDPRSRYMFDGTRKRIVATQGVLADFTGGEVAQAIARLAREALDKAGLDYIQVFVTEDGRRLWVIEDGEPDDVIDGVITLLRPDEY